MDILFFLFGAFSISAISILILKPIAIKLNLLDLPNYRKIHKGNIPLVGGISIFISIFSFTLYIFNLNSMIAAFLVAITLVILMGSFDDRFNLKVSLRLSIQAISAIILMLGSGFYLENLGNLFGGGTVHIGVVGIVFTIIAVIGAVNAFNMIDGIDGLAGTLSIISFGSLAILFGANFTREMILSIVFIGAIIAYLMFNLEWPIKKLPKVYMGDSGSMMIGLSIVWLLIFGTQSIQPAFKPSTALWIIAVPLMDMASTMSRRILRGFSPFNPDRTHIHHLLMQVGFSSRQTLIIVSAISIGYATIGIILEYTSVPERYSIILFLILFVFYVGILHFLRNFVKSSESFS